jgi:hypothetical protein
MKKVFLLTLSTTILSMLAFSGAVSATPLTIYDIQYTTNTAGTSPYVGQTVDCTGGIVINKFGGSKPKVTLYNPAYADGWGGLAIKDWTSSKSFYNTVQIGDWVSFTGTPVEESSGNTQLQFQSTSGYSIVSSGNALPAPVVVSPAAVAAPLYQSSPQGWFVADHSAEKYEAMYLKLLDVTVMANGLGKAGDNYSLQNPTGSAAWASDYMNADTGGRLYHPLVTVGTHFQSVAGIIEQYAKTNATGNSWDYYQMLTTGTGDFVVPEPASCLILLAGAGLALNRRRATRCAKTR